MQKYIVAGATSGTGNEVIKRLVRKVGLENITCLVRSTSDIRLLEEIGLALHVCDIAVPETYQGLLGPSTVYLDMTHPKHYHKSLAAVIAAGVQRAYFVTTTGVFSKYRRCAQIYIENEEKIRRSGIVYTILRPSMIYGSLRDKNIHRLILFLNRFPVFPLFNGGKSLMQPVYAEDLAEGIVAAVGDGKTAMKAFNLAGPEPISYGEIVDVIIRELGKRVIKVNVNTMFAYWLVKGVQWVPGFPINDEQVLRLKEDKVFDISAAVRELNFSPRRFAEGIRQEIAEMRQAGVL